MTDKQTTKEPAKAETDKFQKQADAYAKDFTKEPGYSYRTKVVGGQTVVTVKKLGK